MNFKLWLEADETHPFEIWHKEYQDAREAERTYRSDFEYRRYRNMPQRPVPKVDSRQLLKDPRTKDVYIVDVLELDNYTSGMHGYGDQDDVAASDPAHGAEWKIEINSMQEKILFGKTAFVVDRSGGSFHERWLRIKVCVIVNDIVNKDGYDYDTPDNEQLNWYTFGNESYSDGNFNKIVKVFKFQSLKQASEVVEALEPNVTFPVEDGESRDDYWKRVMASVDKTPPTDQSGYNSSDDYYKR